MKKLKIASTLVVLLSSANVLAFTIDTFDTAQTVDTGAVATLTDFIYGTGTPTAGATVPFPSVANVDSGMQASSVHVGPLAIATSGFDTRSLAVLITENGSIPAPSSTAASSGTLQLSSPASTRTNWAVEWKVGTGQDITDGGTNDLLAYNILNINTSASFRWYIQDSAGESAFANSPTHSPFDAASYSFALSDFTDNNALLDLGSITKLVLYANGTAGNQGKDLTMDFIRTTNITVPEPSVFALMGLGLFGFAASRMKKTA